jgi:hypothetical protein
MTVLIHNGRANHRVNSISIRDRLVQSFDVDHASAFGAHVPVGSRVEREALTAG